MRVLVPDADCCHDRQVSESERLEPMPNAGEPESDQPAPAPGSPTPTSPSEIDTPEQQDRRKAIIRYTVFVVGGALLTVLLYFLLSTFIPRWWSRAIGRQAAGRVSAGIVLGLVYGFVFTFLPLIVAAQARHKAFAWPAKVVILLVAAALTAPSLMTLGIAIGTTPAAQTANQSMNTTAPGFRQATLWGVIIGAVTAIIVITFTMLWQRQGHRLKLLQARVDELERQLPPAPASATPVTRPEKAVGGGA